MAGIRRDTKNVKKGHRYLENKFTLLLAIQALLSISLISNVDFTTNVTNKSITDVTKNAAVQLMVQRKTPKSIRVTKKFRHINKADFPYKCGILLFYHLPCTGMYLLPWNPIAFLGKLNSAIVAVFSRRNNHRQVVRRQSCSKAQSHIFHILGEVCSWLTAIIWLLPC